MGAFSAKSNTYDNYENLPMGKDKQMEVYD